MAQATDEIVEQTQWQGHRLVVAHNPWRAAEQTQERLARIHALQQRADQLAGKLQEERLHRRLEGDGAT